VRLLIDFLANLRVCPLAPPYCMIKEKLGPLREDGAFVPLPKPPLQCNLFFVYGHLAKNPSGSALFLSTLFPVSPEDMVPVQSVCERETKTFFRRPTVPYFLPIYRPFVLNLFCATYEALYSRGTTSLLPSLAQARENSRFCLLLCTSPKLEVLLYSPPPPRARFPLTCTLEEL